MPPPETLSMLSMLSKIFSSAIPAVVQSAMMLEGVMR
jgi:hypothetical protein